MNLVGEAVEEGIGGGGCDVVALSVETLVVITLFGGGWTLALTLLAVSMSVSEVFVVWDSILKSYW